IRYKRAKRIATRPQAAATGRYCRAQSGIRLPHWVQTPENLQTSSAPRASLSRRTLVERPHAAGLGASIAIHGSSNERTPGRRRAGRTRCIRAWLIAMALVSTVVSTLAGVAHAQEDRVEAECRNLLHRSVFNCGCTAEFLEDHLGSEQADILLRLWTYGENGG